MDGDSPTSLARAFQYLSTPSEKKFFLLSNLNLPWHNLRPLLLVPSLLPGRRGQPSPRHSVLCRNSFQVFQEFIKKQNKTKQNIGVGLINFDRDGIGSKTCRRFPKLGDFSMRSSHFDPTQTLAVLLI